MVPGRPLCAGDRLVVPRRTLCAGDTDGWCPGGRCMRGLTGHGHAAAPGTVLILTQLAVKFGLGDGGGRGGQVWVTQLPEEEGRGEHKLLLRGAEE